MISRKQNAWERRLREIEREKERLREQVKDVRRWTHSISDADQLPQEPKWRGTATPDIRRSQAVVGSYGFGLSSVPVLEIHSEESPENETSLDFSPGPDGLETKRVVMPRLQRTDLLRPAISAQISPNKLVEPQYDRFRNYFGTTGLKRVREARKEQGSQRIRAIFMMIMVLMLGSMLGPMVCNMKPRSCD